MSFFTVLRGMIGGSGAPGRSRHRAAGQGRRAPRLRVEQLEDRLVPSNFTAAAAAHLIADINATTAQPLGVAHPTAAPGTVLPADWTGSPNPPYTPQQIRHAYGFDQVANQGSGQTIYIVDAFDNPTVASDLTTFDTQFGLPAPPSFTVHQMSKNIKTNNTWGLEEDLDVQWAHAIAPQANIVLVEAETNAFNRLLDAVDWATNNGATIVSMSWGSSEGAYETKLDSTFNHPGVSYVAAAGDTGGLVWYPSASPYVLSVGGTSLYLDSNGNYLSESAWSSGGGGASRYEPEPGYQTSYGISLSGRGTPDVAYNADPNTGVYIYDASASPPGWYEYGGTSAGAPQWSALIALADESRSTPLSTTDLTSRIEYDAATGSVYSSNYHDITTGSNGNPAGTGYDLATGLGTPQANNLVPWLIADPATAAAPAAPGQALAAIGNSDPAAANGFLATPVKPGPGSLSASAVPNGDGTSVSCTGLDGSTCSGELADPLFALVGDESAFGAHATPQVVAANAPPSAPVPLPRFDALLSMGAGSRTMFTTQDNGMPGLLLTSLSRRDNWPLANGV